MVDLKPSMYAIGVIEGYFQALATSGDKQAAAMLEALAVVEGGVKQAAQENYELRGKLNQIRAVFA